MMDPTHYVPDSIPSNLHNEYAVVCRDFERAWHDDDIEKPQIESYANRVEESDRLQLIDILIAIDVKLRTANGEIADETEYHERFPHNRKGIKYAFSLVARTSTKSQLEPDGKSDHSSIPERIGRYNVQKTIGEGGFGVVCLAHDTQLNRNVALKFARKSRFKTKTELNTFIQEARTAAQLDCAGIVTVFDVLQMDDLVCIVQQFVEGNDLKTELGQRKPTFERTAQIIRDVALALSVAHQKGFIHRDVKPANILLDVAGNPHVADFGLAIHESVQRRQRGERSGTPRYMSPELVLGETHRLDGRSDLWSLGIVMFEMLTRKRPFNGATRAELFDEIKNREPRPPRQIDPKIPRELDRICLKLLSKRIVDRYPTGEDLVEDINHFLNRNLHEKSVSGIVNETVQSPDGNAETEIGSQQDVSTYESQNQPKIVPKGLRSFDDDDADFFLQLLPGPRDRMGLPEGMRFWTHFIRQKEARVAGSLGLIYGPSGCGKSSLVKAGLLPRLDENVVPIYVEATKDDTEARLHAALISNVPGASYELSLAQTLDAVREGMWLPKDKKLLIIIDQFEQWLHDRTKHQMMELVRALRHCDGARVQCILMVRDDFWLATSRFLRELEIDLLEGQNAMLVDLFDKKHARHVLTEFGQAYGQLPLELSEFTRNHEEFLDEAIIGLAEEDKVICVRLALFAEMFKGKPWVPSELSRIGGTEGVGFAFLEDTFSAKTAKPEYRQHEFAARKVLGELLPESGTDIRGQMRPISELQKVSGYASKPQAFKDLIRILDKQLRLITLTDPEGIREDESIGNIDTNQAYYQLTHDFLVGSLRGWLTRKKKVTMVGRAELRLAERAEMWTSKQEQKYLPSLWEYTNIRTMTRPSTWTTTQSRMMKSAFGYHSVRVGAVLVVVLAALFIGRYLYMQNASKNLVKLLLQSEFSQVPAIIDDMQLYGSSVDSLLSTAAESTESEDDLLRIRLAKHLSGELQTDFLTAKLLRSDPEEFFVVINALGGQHQQLVDQAWGILDSNASNEESFLRASAIAAQIAKDDHRWDVALPRLVTLLVQMNSFEVPLWVKALSPISPQLLEEYARRLADDSEHGGKLVKLFALFSRKTENVEFVLHNRYKKISLPTYVAPTAEMSVQERVTHRRGFHDSLRMLARQKASLASALFAIGHFELVEDALKKDAELTLSSVFLDRIRKFEISANLIWAELQRSDDPYIRSRLMLSLGQMAEGKSFSFQQQLDELALRTYQESPEGYVHSCAEYLLRKLRPESSLIQIRSLADGHQPDDSKWRHVDRQLTMLSLQGPGKFKVSGIEEPVLLDYEFEISSTEVTIGKFKEIIPDFEYPEISEGSERYQQDFYDREKLTDEHPIVELQSVVFMKFCNELTLRQPGLTKEDCCFVETTVPVLDKEGKEMTGKDGKPILRTFLTLADDYRERKGFRFPNESEWEFACQTLDDDSYVCGVDDDLLDQYTNYDLNNQGNYYPKVVGTKFPNRIGLFDIQGNANELCILENWTVKLGLGTKGGSVISSPKSLVPYRLLPGPIYPGSGNKAGGFRLVKRK